MMYILSLIAFLCYVYVCISEWLMLNMIMIMDLRSHVQFIVKRWAVVKGDLVPNQ